MEQQALSDFSVTKCILAEPTNSSATAVASCCSEQKNVNNNNIVPAEVKQEGDTTLSGECMSILMMLRCSVQ